MTFRRPLVSFFSNTESIASITIGRGTPSSRHFFMMNKSFAERMKGVFRRAAKCASISRKKGSDSTTLSVIQ